MFCENCGKQIPDGSAFCENCGARTAATPAPAAPAAPVATAVPAKKPILAGLMEKVRAIHQKNKLIFPIAGAVLVVAIALIIVFSVLGKQVSVRDYMNIRAEGYDGYGSVNVEFGHTSFGMRAIGDKDVKGYDEDLEEDDDFRYMEKGDVSKKYRDNFKDAQKLVDSIEYEVTYPEDKSNGMLSNGDVIKVKIKCKESYAEDLGLSLQDLTFEYTVEGLKPIEKFDVLSCFELKAEGYDGYGDVELVCSKTASVKVGELTFETEAGENRVYCIDADGYSSSIWPYLDGEIGDVLNGDTVKAKVDMSADLFVRDGVELIGLEKEYTVEGLEETEKVDLLKYYTIEFTGLDGSGKPKATPTQETVTIGDFEVDLVSGNWTRDGKKVAYTSIGFGKGYGLTNGDTVEVYVSYSGYTFRELGVKFINAEQDITVSNLASYITKLEQVKNYTKAAEAAMSDITDYLNRSWGWAVHRHYLNYSDKTIGDDMKLYKAVLVIPAKGDSSYNNYLYLIFSVTLSDNEITTPTTYYIPVRINTPSAYGDGALNGDVSFVNYEAYASYDELYQKEINTGSNQNWTFEESEQF